MAEEDARVAGLGWGEYQSYLTWLEWRARQLLDSAGENTLNLAGKNASYWTWLERTPELLDLAIENARVTGPG